jgi:hypothetical protein
LKLAAIALIFYVICTGCSEQRPQLVYHPWLMSARGNYSHAYFSDIHGRWMCDANNGKPYNKPGPMPTDKCDGDAS